MKNVSAGLQIRASTLPDAYFRALLDVPTRHIRWRLAQDDFAIWNQHRTSQRTPWDRQFQSCVMPQSTKFLRPTASRHG